MNTPVIESKRPRKKFDKAFKHHAVELWLNSGKAVTEVVAESGNRLLFGDNLQWLRDAKLFPDASVDLVYLDPPFNYSKYPNSSTSSR
jgi:16S rRNA G966 N2-methylase RsmD